MPYHRRRTGPHDPVMARIATLGERAEDVFLISGGDLHDSTSRIRLETELMERLKVVA